MGFTWLYCRSPATRCEPATPLYATSNLVEAASCLWMDKLQLLSSGGCVASAPWYQAAAAVFATPGSMEGGGAHAGKPPASTKEGVTPLLPLLVKEFCATKTELVSGAR